MRQRETVFFYYPPSNQLINPKCPEARISEGTMTPRSFNTISRKETCYRQVIHADRRTTIRVLVHKDTAKSRNEQPGHRKLTHSNPHVQSIPEIPTGTLPARQRHHTTNRTQARKTDPTIPLPRNNNPADFTSSA